MNHSLHVFPEFRGPNSKIRTELKNQKSGNRLLLDNNNNFLFSQISIPKVGNRKIENQNPSQMIHLEVSPMADAQLLYLEFNSTNELDRMARVDRSSCRSPINQKSKNQSKIKNQKSKNQSVNQKSKNQKL